MDKTTTAIGALGIAILAGVAIGVGTLRVDDPEIKLELEALALKDATVTTRVLKVCPDCAVSRECCKLPTGNHCLRGLEYGTDSKGNGLGGVDAEGNPVTCSCANATADEIRDCVGDSADHEARMETHKRDASEQDTLAELAVKQAEAEKREPKEAPLAAEEKER